ncbi:exonuclease 3'-5' domain-containing protein 2 [Diaphorina citri]|uniref:Exonuclease 3'-5' domain-containing protein 2 n=1 Tax=Diaphorina citri TaxID=121845 RepID=A0A1S3DUA4_DIACI|nr:exonuclease 3'-5' domain-containing protein 2 [Diaphorina citri]
MSSLSDIDPYTIILPVSLMGLYLFRKKIMSKMRMLLCGVKDMHQVFYVESQHKCDEIIAKHFVNHKVLGLDCEWVTIGNHRGPVSLLQLASPDGVCALFRMNKIYQYDYFSNVNTIPESLENLLNDPMIVKVGVAIENDSKYLYEDYEVDITSWLDLRHIAKQNNVLPRGLAYLAQETVGGYFYGKDFVSLKQSIFGFLFRSRPSVYESYINQHCFDYLGVPYRDKPSAQAKFLGPNRPESSLPSRRSYSTESRPWKGFRPGKVYDNCYLLDSLGQVLCTCDRKKAQWYLDKDLGSLVREDPFTVRLSFQPEGFDREDCKYYSEEKRNQCVVCGSEERYSLVKKYIVPHEYRKYLPDYMKDRRSHDVLLMCYRCHMRSNMKDQAMRKSLARLCNAPLDSKTNKAVTHVDEIRKVKSAARALLRHTRTKQLPDERFFDLVSLVDDYFVGDPRYKGLSMIQLIQIGSQLCETVQNAEFVSHGQAVVTYFQERDQLELFETRWRQHFLETMRPEYLPKHWSLHHNFERRKTKVQNGREFE